MVADQFIVQGHRIKQVLEVCEIPRSSYYYKPKGEKGLDRGMKPSQTTYRKGVGQVSNDEIVEEIITLLAQEFVDYGYLKVTHWLRKERGYVINPKKVYRLMKQAGLLNKRVVPKVKDRRWVKELVPDPVSAFDYLEVDIKHVYVAGRRKNALLISVIDVKSRWVLAQQLEWRINRWNVLQLFDRIFSTYDVPHRFYLRSDNGSQFIATEVQKYFENKGVVQEFTRPATPEQNAHIESYFSIVERVICQRYEFESLPEAQQTFNRFIRFYNFERIHSGIRYNSPYKYLLQSGMDMKSQIRSTDDLNSNYFQTHQVEIMSS